MIQSVNSPQSRAFSMERAFRPVRLENNVLLLLGFLLTFVGPAVAQPAVAQDDPGWPRLHTQPSGKLLIYQPQVDKWKDFKEISGRFAFAMTPAGGKELIGAADLEASTDVDTANRTVLFTNVKVTKVHFPSLPPANVPAMEALFRSFIPDTLSMSLDHVAACVPKPGSVNNVPLNNEPPRIFVSYNPAILLEVNGQPVYGEIAGTHLKFVVNTSWPLFQETSKSEYYLLVGQQWLTTNNLQGPWSATSKLPKDMLVEPAGREPATRAGCRAAALRWEPGCIQTIG